MVGITRNAWRILLLAVFFQVVAWGAESLVCDLCGQKIKGKYIRVEQGGVQKNFCEECYVARAPKCDFCGKSMIGQYMTFNTGQKACQECLAGKRCSLCNRPAPDGVEEGGKVLCKECAAKPHACAACGSLLTGTFYRLPFVYGVFCESCVKSKPRCSMCGRPIAEHPVMKLAGDRPICRVCLKDSVLTLEGMQKILDQSAVFAQQAFGMTVAHALPLKIVEDINLVRKDSGMPGSGTELGLFHWKGDQFTIYVLGGLPYELALETLMHEWTHAWFAEHASPQHPDWVQEGFCQWTASKILRENGYPASISRLRDRTDLYGKGFRYVQEIEDKAGHAGAVLEYMKRPPPPGKPAKKM